MAFKVNAQGGVAGRRVPCKIYDFKVTYTSTKKGVKSSRKAPAVASIKEPIAKLLGWDILDFDDNELTYTTPIPGSKTGGEVTHVRKGTHRGGKAVTIIFRGTGRTLPGYKDGKVYNRNFKTITFSIPKGVPLFELAKKIKANVKDAIALRTPDGKSYPLNQESTK